MKLCFVFLASFLLVSCTTKEPTAEATPTPSQQSTAPTAAPLPAAPPRPDFDNATIKIGAKEITVEVADNDEERSYGLMYVERMAADAGMLFVFQEPRRLTFWMKNTRIPLSIAYINEKKRIIDILDMVPASDMDSTPPVYPSSGPAKYALEMNVGWFKKNKIKVGDSLVLP